MRAWVLAALLLSTAAQLTVAQAQAPASGSNGGGPVGPSVATPTIAEGATPPGTPSDDTAAGRASRDAVGQAVLGKTSTPDTPVAGNTGAPETGTAK